MNLFILILFLQDIEFFEIGLGKKKELISNLYDKIARKSSNVTRDITKFSRRHTDEETMYDIIKYISVMPDVRRTLNLWLVVANGVHILSFYQYNK